MNSTCLHTAATWFVDVCFSLCPPVGMMRMSILRDGTTRHQWFVRTGKISNTSKNLGESNSTNLQLFSLLANWGAHLLCMKQL
ncbi:hypothetical protein QBC39DRAFT_340355 [Podospora conica]|nr:hypothetical protein QBC39DRAFT_340355 [Schizothecium conicum]